jgi:hypothetical protein
MNESNELAQKALAHDTSAPGPGPQASLPTPEQLVEVMKTLPPGASPQQGIDHWRKIQAEIEFHRQLEHLRQQPKQKHHDFDSGLKILFPGLVVRGPSEKKREFYKLMEFWLGLNHLSGGAKKTSKPTEIQKIMARHEAEGFSNAVLNEALEVEAMRKKEIYKKRASVGGRAKASKIKK